VSNLASVKGFYIATLQEGLVADYRYA